MINSFLCLFLHVVVLLLMFAPKVHAESIKLTRECIQSAKSQPDCLLMYLDEPSLARKIRFPSALKPGPSREVNPEKIVKLFTLARNQPGMLLEQDIELISRTSAGCDSKNYLRFKKEFEALDFDSTEYSLEFIGSIWSCRERTPDLVHLVESMVESDPNKKVEIYGLMWLSLNFAYEGDYSKAIDTIRKLYRYYDPSIPEFSNAQLYGASVGATVSRIVATMLGSGNVEEALTLTRLLMSNVDYEHFFSTLAHKVIPGSQPEPYTSFANQIEFSGISEYARSGAIAASLESGRIDEALRLLRELGEGRAPLVERDVYTQLLILGRDNDAKALAEQFNISTNQSPISNSEMMTHLMNRVRSHDWLAVSEIIDRQQVASIKLEILGKVGAWTLQDFEKGGPSIESAKRSIPYFRASHALVAKNGGHKLRAPLPTPFIRDFKEINEISSRLADTGMIQAQSLRMFSDKMLLDTAFYSNDFESFVHVVEEVKEGGFAINFSDSKYCWNLKTIAQANICIFGLKEKGGTNAGSGVCNLLAKHAASLVGPIQAIEYFEEFEDPLLRAQCALEVWAVL